MRRLVPLSLVLLLAACAGGRDEEPASAPAPVASEHRHGRLDGLGVQELGELFGMPTLQVREGAGLKLQYRGGGCVLDVYLYPPASGQGIERVTHVDARQSSGADTDIAGCEAAIEASR